MDDIHAIRDRHLASIDQALATLDPGPYRDLNEAAADALRWCDPLDPETIAKHIAHYRKQAAAAYEHRVFLDGADPERLKPMYLRIHGNEAAALALEALATEAGLSL